MGQRSKSVRRGVPYELPAAPIGLQRPHHFARQTGMAVFLAYTDREIAWRMKRKNHAGLAVCADNPQRVQDLLDSYMPRFYDDFHTTLPAPDNIC